MEAKHVDVAIIGAGSAGMRAYREATRVTDSVLLIEGAEYGTTCAHVGCMPSKLLIAAAEAAYSGAHAREFGVEYGPPAIDGVAVMDRVRRERDRDALFRSRLFLAHRVPTLAAAVETAATPVRYELAGFLSSVRVFETRQLGQRSAFLVPRVNDRLCLIGDDYPERFISLHRKYHLRINPDRICEI